MFELSARRAFACVNVRGLNLAPLDCFERIQETDPTAVRLIIVGFGQMGRHLALQAAKIGHFANFRKPKITVVESTGSARPTRFLAEYPRFHDLCDYQFVETAKERSELISKLRALTKPADGARELVTRFLLAQPQRADEER